MFIRYMTPLARDILAITHSVMIRQVSKDNMTKRVLLITVFFAVISSMFVIPQMIEPSMGDIVFTFAGLLVGSLFMGFAVSLFMRLLLKR